MIKKMILLALAVLALNSGSLQAAAAKSAAATAPRYEDTCKPGTADATSWCKGGCCHYALWEIAANCTAHPVQWQPPKSCDGAMLPPAALCASVVFQDRDGDAGSVTFNDTRMNPCLASKPAFMHLLTIPRKRVCGNDDPARFELASSIWNSAWKAARAFLAKQQQEGTISGAAAEMNNVALVVNSVQQRSQNQLHVHALRLKPGIREEIMRLSPPPAHISSLNEVWDTAAQLSGGRASYGMLVMRDLENSGFLVAVTDGGLGENPTPEHNNSPESRFTCGNCNTCP